MKKLTQDKVRRILVQQWEWSLDCAIDNTFSITIPSGYTYVDRFAFADFKNLVTIILPPGITTIESCAFNSNKKLTKLVLPQSIRTLRSGAFAGCDGLKNLIIETKDKENYQRILAMLPEKIRNITSHSDVNIQDFTRQVLTANQSLFFQAMPPELNAKIACTLAQAYEWDLNEYKVGDMLKNLNQP